MSLIAKWTCDRCGRDAGAPTDAGLQWKPTGWFGAEVAPVSAFAGLAKTRSFHWCAQCFNEISKMLPRTGAA